MADQSAFTVLEEGSRQVLAVRPVPRAPLGPADPHEPDAGPQTILDPKFSRALDFKLRRLKQREAMHANLRRPERATVESPSPGRRRRAARTTAEEEQRPRFVTTVRAGRFLPPPPQYAQLLGLESLYPPEPDRLVYEYSSRPHALAPRGRRAPPPPPAAPSTTHPAAPPVSSVFAGVRALIAGVAGLKHAQAYKQNGNTTYSNVMHDKRVVRGSVFAAHPHAAGDGVSSMAARAASTRRRALARRAAAARLRPGTPPPAPGRRHHPIQTEYYLEELFDKGVEMSVGVQTDLFLDRPATPLYVPAKTGTDCATQIYPGDLFDFDVEVQPVLEALVGGTAAQALAETAREEELAALREQQRRFRELRDAERAERARLADQDRRLQEEKERRISEGRLAAAAASEARSRAAATTLVQGYVAELIPSALSSLRDQGFLLDAVRRGVDDEFMPWLVEEVTQELHALVTNRDLVTEMVREVVSARAAQYLACGEREAAAPSVPDSLTPPDYGLEEEEDYQHARAVSPNV